MGCFPDRIHGSRFHAEKFPQEFPNLWASTSISAHTYLAHRLSPRAPATAPQPAQQSYHSPSLPLSLSPNPSRRRPHAPLSSAAHRRTPALLCGSAPPRATRQHPPAPSTPPHVANCKPAPLLHRMSPTAARRCPVRPSRRAPVRASPDARPHSLRCAATPIS